MRKSSKVAAPAQADTTVNKICEINEVSDVIKKVEERSFDVAEFYKHYISGTTEAYYQQILYDTIFDLALFPVERDFRGVEVVDDKDSVVRGLHQIASILSTLFSKNQNTVEQDMVREMNNFPTDDVRQSRTLHHLHRLH